ncbi:hypothetical protein JCM10207_005093 [Rhodosporidiobolus poonsookiae]
MQSVPSLNAAYAPPALSYSSLVAPPPNLDAFSSAPSLSNSLPQSSTNTPTPLSAASSYADPTAYTAQPNTAVNTGARVANGMHSPYPLSLPDGYAPSPAPSMERVGSTASANGLARSDKGKSVVRDSVDETEDEALRQRKVERILKRAEAAKLARTFRNRLALASFKSQRGWHDETLDTIEPHLEQEALKRRGQPPIDFASPMPPVQGLPVHPHHQAFEPSPSSYPQPLPPQQLYVQQSPYGASPMPYPQQPPPPPHLTGDLDAMLEASALLPPPPSKRPRQGRGANNSYSDASVYAPQPQPLTHLSPYSTAGVYQSGLGGPSPLGAGAGAGSPGAFGHGATPGRGTKRRLPSQDGAVRIGMASPRARTKTAGRRSPGKSGIASGQPPNPLSSSDPNFSSFVDAAAALTGMARAPSDPSQNGSDEDGHGLGGGAGAGAAVPFLGATAGGGAVNGSPFPPRPSTPERTTPVKLPAAPGGSGGEGSDSAAADLMLFLAQSPSPVRTRTSTNLGGGPDGVAVKGRRLFSGAGEADGLGGGEGGEGDASIFGGELGSSAGLDAPFGSATPGAGTGSGDSPARPDPTKSTAHAASSLAVPSAADGTETPAPLALGGPLQPPATPGRDRQPSLNGASWESFINASPSPKRGGGGRRLSGEEVSPPHATVGGEA